MFFYLLNAKVSEARLYLLFESI